jgi:nifR3 family TIM-barrel protein
LYKVAEAVVKAAGGTPAAGGVPVTVKIRSGWESKQITWREAAQAALDAGVSAITIHPRTRAQGYEGHSDWGIMRELVELVREWESREPGRHVPVFGSGDLFKPEDAKAMLEETGADAVMFARGAMGNPFIFRDATDLLTKGSYEPVPPEERVKTGFAELERLVAETSEQHACLEMRKRFAAYSKGISGGAALRARIVHAATVADYKDIFSQFI